MEFRVFLLGTKPPCVNAQTWGCLVLQPFCVEGRWLVTSSKLNSGTIRLNFKLVCFFHNFHF